MANDHHQSSTFFQPGDLIEVALGEERVRVRYLMLDAPDLEEPLVLLDGSTVKAVCEHLHRDFVNLFRYALVWGKSAKFPGQSVGLDHELKDSDILSIITKRR